LRRFVLIALALLAPAVADAQTIPTRATRADGSVVLLYPDGTWHAESTATSSPKVVTGASYTTPAGASDQLDLGRGVTLHFNPAKWQRAASPSPGRLMLRHVDGDGYTLVIYERLQIPTANLRNIAMEHVRSASPDIKIIRDEQRRVNGTDVEAVEFSGTAQGIPFHWLAYYFGGAPGAVQVLTFSGESLFSGFQADFQDMLNGLQVDKQ